MFSGRDEGCWNLRDFSNQMPTTVNATNPLYRNGGEVAVSARRCTLMCYVMSTEFVLDVFRTWGVPSSEVS